MSIATYAGRDEGADEHSPAVTNTTEQSQHKGWIGFNLVLYFLNSSAEIFRPRMQD